MTNFLMLSPIWPCRVKGIFGITIYGESVVNRRALSDTLSTMQELLSSIFGEVLIRHNCTLHPSQTPGTDTK